MSAIRILEEIRDKKKLLEERIISESIQDFSSYKYCVGQIHGLEFATKTIVRIIGENT